MTPVLRAESIDMTVKKEIYVASPLGFSEAGRFFLYEKLFPVLQGCGLGIIDPWALTPKAFIEEIEKMPCGEDRREAWRRLNFVIGENNRRGIESSDGLFAVLDGPDVDSGTASEIGFASALGKTIIAYRGDFRSSGDNEGSVVNIQVEYFIHDSGGKIVSTLEEAEREVRRVFTSSSL